MKKLSIILLILALTWPLSAKDFKIAWTHPDPSSVQNYRVEWGVNSYLTPKSNIIFDNSGITTDTKYTVTIPDGEMTTNGGYQIWFRVLANNTAGSASSDTLTYTEYFRADMDRESSKTEVTALDHARFQDRFTAIYQRPALNFLFPKNKIPDVQPQF